MVMLLYQQRQKKKKKIPALPASSYALPYTTPLHLLVMLTVYCSALNPTEDGTQATAVEKTKGCDLNYRDVV